MTATKKAFILPWGLSLKRYEDGATEVISPWTEGRGLEMPSTAAWGLSKKPAQKTALGINLSDIV